MREYRVWTKNWKGQPTPITDWNTRSQCRRAIIARWQHWPPWAYISQARTVEGFVRYNGD